MVYTVLTQNKDAWISLSETQGLDHCLCESYVDMQDIAKFLIVYPNTKQQTRPESGHISKMTAEI